MDGRCLGTEALVVTCIVDFLLGIVLVIFPIDDFNRGSRIPC